MVASALRDFGQVLPHSHVRKVLPRPESNRCSVALVMRFADIQIILGADLKAENDSQLGWRAALNCQESPDEFQIIKVPHHGARSAHDSRLWEIAREPYAAVTPYFRGKSDLQLPTAMDIDRLQGCTPHLYLTASKAQSPAKHRDRAVRRFADSITKSRRATEARRVGHVRIRGRRRRAIEVECFEGAVHLNER
jgi:hypothetical protein